MEKEERLASERILLEIYDQRRGRLWWIANNLLKDEETAEDVVQMVFEKFWKEGIIKGTRAEQVAYIEKAVENRTKDLITAIVLENSKILRLPGPVVEGKDPEEILVERETIEELMQEIEKLPARDRMLVQYLILDGRSYNEMSKKMKVRKSALYVQMYRIRQRLRWRLRPRPP